MPRHRPFTFYPTRL
ncbi:uncharacterized protein FPRN_15256 [Fusarium proliferatum]|nr:uncharacterized protein FPRN_15256 [Fusarium proliferatum]